MKLSELNQMNMNRKNIHLKVFCTILISISFYGFVFSQTQRSIDEPMRTRQVHLDFHTSEQIPGIGERFDKKQWQEALQTGRVNHINIFGKGHHSMAYYPTKVGTMHPHLKFDLLGAQIEACHEIGVKCPIYFTIGWSSNDAEAHPEWCMRDVDGSFLTINYDTKASPETRRPNYSWKCMCPAPSGPYHQHIKKQVSEICDGYEVDGFWFDIYHIHANCYCQFCRERLQNEGVDLNDNEAVKKSTIAAFKAHMKELRELVAEYHPEATVYFNATTRLEDKQIFKQRLYNMNTHQDLEDLPTTWGGYDKLPLDAKFHLGQGVPITGMSGKFHKAWGEFGGFKHPDAIKYEAAAMIAFGGTCNFGDQLHPSGDMDIETYRNIGEAYKYVETIEDYGPGGKPVSKLGMWLTLNESADHGLVRILLELHYDFVVANLENLNELELLIIPSRACLKDDDASAINNWIKKGGKLIVFNEGALNSEKDKMILDVGAEFVETSPYDFDFTVIEDPLSENVVSTPFLNYEAGIRIKPTSADILAWIREPYFNRTYKHYSSHRETPYKLSNSEYPAIVQNGNVIYFAHHLDKLYYEHAVRLHREVVKNAIDRLYEKPMLKVNNLPSAGRVSFLDQENQNRYVAHLLYTPGLQRGEVMVIEDFLPVPGVEIEVNAPKKIKKVYQVPSGKKLRFKTSENGINVKVPEFTMHTGIVMEY